MNDIKKALSKREKNIDRLTLAIGVALFPPLWGLVTEAVGIKIGAVAMICAGLFAANGNKLEDTLKIIIGFLVGNLWGLLAVIIINKLPFVPFIKMFIVLLIMGFTAVMIVTTRLERLIYLPALLTGWAITKLILCNISYEKIVLLSAQIAISMIVGVVYVGIGILKFQMFLKNIINANMKDKLKEKEIA